jgi:hypothetical protein
VVLGEGQPPFARVAAALNLPKIPGYGPFRDNEAGFLKFSVDLGSAPIRVVCRQPADQTTNLIGDLWPAAARPGSPTPVETETGPSILCGHNQLTYSSQTTYQANAPNLLDAVRYNRSRASLAAPVPTRPANQASRSPQNVQDLQISPPKAAAECRFSPLFQPRSFE